MEAPTLKIFRVASKFKTMAKQCALFHSFIGPGKDVSFSEGGNLEAFLCYLVPK